MRLTAEYVYTSGASGVIKNGYVEFDEADGTIVSVGECSADEQITPGALTPGFVNGHCHIELSHLHGKFRKGTGMAGFIDQINELRDWAGRDEKVRLTRYWMDKMWADGVSAMADISNDDSSFDVKKSHDMYTRTFLEVFGSEPHMCEGVMEEVTALNATADQAGIDAAPTPHSCYTMSPELLSASAAAGLAKGFLSYHSQESQEEEDMIISGTGALAENYKGRNLPTPPVTGKPALLYFIERLLSFSQKPVQGRIMLVHNVATNQESIDAALENLAEPFWTICPLSNIFIHRQLPPLDMMRKNNLAICLGTDSLSSNHILSIVEEIKCLHKHFPHISLEEILTWACLNGAKALGFEEELGSFEVGKKPGVVLIENIDWDKFQLSENSRSRRLV
jgi:cytosine/adenosine deaminase-related metal-dependent hydrolase